MAFGKRIRTGSDTEEDTAPWEGPTWQYATVTGQTSSEIFLDRLNMMGPRGWEAVGITVVGSTTLVLMKRRTGAGD